ncbi:hypothetical protein C8R45DRAFT_989853 [Mycena sanguinolenta]|nr:hypothetical protein C8R45DRAFT_989853 [Mycena sanguinolenta]
MPRGRPRLDPDTKLQHVQESRRRYEEKNAAQRREAARLRMQKHRADIANSDIITRRRYSIKVSIAARRYRSRKYEEERTRQHLADAAKRRVRNTEARALREKHKNAAKQSPAPAAKLRAAMDNTPVLTTSPSRQLHHCCPHCFGEDHIQCTCVGSDSKEEFEHADGHFFPTCSCGEQDCSGCICECLKSKVWKEHGEHF